MLLAQHKVKVQQRHYKRIVDKKTGIFAKIVPHSFIREIDFIF